MVEARDRDRFLTEAFDHSRAGEQRGRHHLDRDLSVQRDLPREVDRSHPAAADLSENFELSGHCGPEALEDSLPGGGHIAGCNR